MKNKAPFERLTCTQLGSNEVELKLYMRPGMRALMDMLPVAGERRSDHW